MNELSKVDILFLESIIADAPKGGEHKFSLRYKIRKHRIIGVWKRMHSSSQYRKPVIKMKYIFIAIILACIFLLGGFGIFNLFEKFRLTDYDIYSMLYIVDDISSYPETIEDKFYIDMDMRGYEVQIICDDRSEYWVEYRKDKSVLSLRQMPANVFKQIRLNSENFINEPQQIIINNWNGVLLNLENEGYYYIFNTGEYIITFSGNFAQNDVNNIVKTTKFE